MNTFSKESDLEKNNLDLLKFACSKEGVPKEKLYIGLSRDFVELSKDKGLEDKICLLKRDDSMWEVSYIEKGQKSSLSNHSKMFDAINDAWRRLTLENGPWKYFQEFQNK